MSDDTSNPEPPPDSVPEAAQYVVVARRYRPQVFEELVGQEHIAKALSNAIATNRVGHAYLFTGARGVGKTSAARILGKALNCHTGPAPVPCNECDVCLSISGGDDVDVLEIDGASNRGIDEIRQLRQNVNVRPSRCRFKIYIIDEVHMLTREAFNALLKTLEEPPEHVKFIFCTTEPTKIPITILSRCQRFDFAGILTRSIFERLCQIVEAEGVEAEPEALEVLARRAAGSMRDSQSLLEQLLAFSSGKIALEDVHGMLGTAGDSRLTELAGHLVERDAAAALADLDTAVGEGVDVAQLVEQLFGYFRDCMAAAVDCKAESFLYASPSNREEVAAAGKRMGLSTVLAVMQILDQTLSRMRYSTQGRILAELAFVRICCLEELDELPELIARLQSGDCPVEVSPRRASRPAPARPAAPKNNPAGTTAETVSPSTDSPAADSPSTDAPAVSLSSANAAEVWAEALTNISGMVVEQAKQFDHVAFSAPNSLVVTFKSRYALAKSSCERPDQVVRFEEALAKVAGGPVRIRFSLDEQQGAAAEPTAEPSRPVSPQQRMLEIAEHPMVRRAEELFGARPVRIDDSSKQE